jgi:hypothetical protein
LENGAERLFSHQANKKSLFAIWPEAALQSTTPLTSVTLLETEGQGIFNVSWKNEDS